jgi:hypothetical protein
MKKCRKSKKIGEVTLMMRNRNVQMTMMIQVGRYAVAQFTSSMQ